MITSIHRRIFSSKMVSTENEHLQNLIGRKKRLTSHAGALEGGINPQQQNTAEPIEIIDNHDHETWFGGESREANK